MKTPTKGVARQRQRLQKKGKNMRYESYGRAECFIVFVVQTHLVTFDVS